MKGFAVLYAALLTVLVFLTDPFVAVLGAVVGASTVLFLTDRRWWLQMGGYPQDFPADRLERAVRACQR